jgi:hypothetical protein
MGKKQVVVPEERILSKILVIREEKVMLDVHLAELYGVETRALKQAVRRNLARFPYAFTETGVAMLSSVLRSERAVEMNVAIMRTFVAMRKMALNHRDIMKKLEEMRAENDQKFKDIYAALEYLLTPPNPPRKAIGFKAKEE